MKQRLNNIKPLKDRRKTLRNDLTSAEATLWKYLQHRKLDGRKFRRQHSFGNYILDFYCPEEKLAIELDGTQHFTEGGRRYDELRTAYLEAYGIMVVRFENCKVFENIDDVLKIIKDNFKKTE